MLTREFVCGARIDREPCIVETLVGGNCDNRGGPGSRALHGAVGRRPSRADRYPHSARGLRGTARGLQRRTGSGKHFGRDHCLPTSARRERIRLRREARAAALRRGNHEYRRSPGARSCAELSRGRRRARLLHSSVPASCRNHDRHRSLARGAAGIGCGSCRPWVGTEWRSAAIGNGFKARGTRSAPAARERRRRQRQSFRIGITSGDAVRLAEPLSSSRALLTQRSGPS